MILKQVIHYPETNSVEATWVERVEIPAPFVEGHDVYIPPTIEERNVRCHSYADVQMDMLRTDLGADAVDYEDLIRTVEGGLK